MKKIKIWGPKRSGTNLLKWILQHFPNVEVLVDKDVFGERAWKHGFPRKAAEFNICISKDIVAEYVSNRCFWDGGNESVNNRKLLLEEFSELEGADPASFHTIYFECLLTNWHDTIREIADFLKEDPPAIARPERRVDITSDSHSAHLTPFPFNADYFLSEEYNKDICPIESSFLRGFSDLEGNPDVVHVKQPYFGYGDIVMTIWVLQGLIENGKRPILYVDPSAQEFARIWYPHYQVAVIQKAPEWAVSIGFERVGNKLLQTKSHIQMMWDKLPEDWTRGGEPKRPKCNVTHEKPVRTQEKADRGVTDKARVLLFPLAAHRVRQWPIEHWRKLARDLHNAGYKVGVATSAGMREEAARVSPKEKSTLPIVTDDWKKTIKYILDSDLVITNDSGPAHIAGTLGIKTMAIHAMQDPVIFSPYESVQSVFSDAPCAGCCGCSENGYSPALCNPDAIESQPNIQTNPQGGAFGPGCPELKGIAPSLVFGKVKEVMGKMAFPGCEVIFFGNSGGPDTTIEDRLAKLEKQFGIKNLATITDE